MKSINTKLTAIMLSVVLVSIIIIIGIGTVLTRLVVVREGNERILSETGKQAVVMDEWVTKHMATVNTTSTILSQIDEFTKDKVSGILKEVMNQENIYQDVVLGLRDNTAIMGSGYPIENEYSWWKATERDWYQLAATNPDQAVVNNLYVDGGTKNLCITVARAVKRNNTVIGVVGIDIMIDDIQRLVNSATLNATGYSMLLDTNGDIMIHRDDEYMPGVDKAASNINIIRNGIFRDLWTQIENGDRVYEHKNEDGTSCYFIASTFATTGWHLVTVLPMSVLSKPVTDSSLILIPVTLVILLISSLLIFMTVRNIVSVPLVPAAAFFNKSFTTGDMTIEQKDMGIITKYSAKKDEVGLLIRSALGFVKRINAVSEALESVAGGDLTSELEPLSPKDKLGHSVKKMTESMNDIFHEINTSTVQFNNGSRQIADRAQALAQGATQQAASVQQLSSSISEIADKTKHNASMAEKASVLSDTIKDNAVRGSQQMDEMMEAVNQINESSGTIGKVIRVIDDIAFQTNILALNAAVEAARAGQHGKGFAVVAEEVRNLAAKSAEAAKDTGVLIENSIEKANLGVRIAGETAESLTEIVTGINESSQLVGEIAKSSEEQSQGIEQINIGIDQVAQVVQHNSASAQEEAASSEEMSSQASILHELISQFKLKGGDKQMRLPGASGRGQKPSDASERIDYVPALNGGSYGKY